MRKWTIGCVLLGLMLCSCTPQSALLPYGRELEDMALMRTMAVDGDAAGGYQVTLSSGLSGGEQEGTPLVLTAQGASVDSAMEEVQGQGSLYLYCGHVGQLVVGEELAFDGINAVLDYIQRDGEMRLETTLYILKDNTAQSAMEELPRQGTSVPDRLEAMEQDPTLIATFEPVTVGEVLSQTNRSGSVAVPALTLTAEGQLMPDGFAILKEGALVGYATEQAAQGIDLLQEYVYRQVVDMEEGTVQMMESNTKVTPDVAEGQLTGVTISCQVEVQVLDREGTTTQEDFELRLEEELKEQIWGALGLSVTTGADFLELQRRAAVTSAGAKELLKSQWDLKNTILTVEVDTIITNSYELF